MLCEASELDVCSMGLLFTLLYSHYFIHIALEGLTE